MQRRDEAPLECSSYAKGRDGVSICLGVTKALKSQWMKVVVLMFVLRATLVSPVVLHTRTAFTKL